MPKGKVYWRGGELVVTWEKVKMGRTIFVQPTSVKDQSVIQAMKPIKEGKESVVEVELNTSGTVEAIKFISEELTEIVEGNEQEQARLKELQTQKSQENEALEKRSNAIPPKSDFHNPYNFVPASPRDVTHPKLGDHAPCGHDKFHSDYFSGKLRVKMTVKTPLVISDTARMSVNAKDKTHKEFPVRVKLLLDEGGNIVKDDKGQIITIPDIESTAVKGLVRSAYEIITNSRMSIFSETERLAYRMSATPQETMEVFPAIIVKKGEESKIRVLRYNNQKQYARLQRYQKNGARDKKKGETTNALKFVSNNQIPKHKDEVWVELDTTNPHAWLVTKIDNISHPNWRKGWVYATGANIKNKKFERVFLDYSSGQPHDLGDLEKDWEDLISNYQKIHEKEIQQREKDGDKPWDFLGDKPSKTAWSRQVYKEDSLSLEDGTLCYAYHENGEVKALLPVIISRRIFPKTPIAMLPKELHPAKSFEQLSPADRVFGWVNQNGKGAYRGQIRLSSIVCKGFFEKKDGEPVLNQNAETIQKFRNWLPMSILGQPKPQQGRFYVAKDKDGTAQAEGLTNEQAGYNLPLVKGLRGRKVYPHHANLPTDYWFVREDTNFENENLTQRAVESQQPRFFREYLRPYSNKQRDSQNRSIEGWIKPGTEFEFDIHFTNLSDVELGALIWLLQLPENHFHRFGGGKPLGFGSVRLELTKFQINKGSELVEFYKSLDSELSETVKTEENKEDFVTIVRDTLINPFLNEIDKFDSENKTKYQDILEAFKVACRGFNDKPEKLPIHYPRARNYKEITQWNQQRNKNEIIDFEYLDNIPLQPKPEGKSFEWFVENAKEKVGLKDKDGNTLIEEIHPKFALDNLWKNGQEDSGLPFLPHKKTGD